MPHRPAHKFDPARADRLESPERDTYLPPARLIDELGLSGGETVVDYGAGTGWLTLPLAHAVGEQGFVLAVDESEPMFERLRTTVAGISTIKPLLIVDNQVPVADASVAAILAANLLHELRGERALEEMHRLLVPGGRLVVADWRRDAQDRPGGPPDELLYDVEEAAAEIERAGFTVRQSALLTYHYVVGATASA